MRPAAAQDAEIPAGVQAQLLSRIPSYDRGFKERAGARVGVLIVVVASRPESVRAGDLLHAALLREKTIAGLPHSTTIHSFTDVPSLVADARARVANIVYLTPGLEQQVPAVCAALEPLQMLTVSIVPEDVQRCAVLGFQLVAGRPKILVHLGHARRNGLDFRSGLLVLAKVYR